MDLKSVLNLKYPLIVAPMAGGPTTPELVIASCEAGALGSIGAAYLAPQAIADVVSKVKMGTKRPFAINLFISEPHLQVPEGLLKTAIEQTASYRLELGLPEPKLSPPFEENFESQFEATLRAQPAALSFVFGILAPEYIEAARQEGILVIGAATSLAEALALQESQVDAIVLQGFEGGGHRAVLDASAADPEIPLFELLRNCQERIKIPLIAAGGLMNAKDIQKALTLGAQAVQMGTAFLACREAGTSAPYRKKLLASAHRKTKTTRVFSGRLARGIENRFMIEMEERQASILPFPAQNKFTRDLRNASAQKGSSDFLSLWSGSGDGDLWQGSATELIETLFAFNP